MPNISWSKGSQIIKFSQLTEYSMTYIFLEKSYTKHGGETSPRTFFKKLCLSIYLEQQFKVLYSLFLLHVQVEDFQNISKLRCWPFAFISYKAFDRRSLELVSLCLNSCMILLYSIYWPNFIVWFVLLEIMSSVCIAVCFPRCDVINSVINLVQLFSHMTKKISTKN